MDKFLLYHISLKHLNIRQTLWRIHHSKGSQPSEILIYFTVLLVTVDISKKQIHSLLHRLTECLFFVTITMSVISLPESNTNSVNPDSEENSCQLKSSRRGYIENLTKCINRVTLLIDDIVAMMKFVYYVTKSNLKFLR